MTDYIDTQGFRANVGIVLIRDGGERVPRWPQRRAWLAVPAGRRAARNESPEDALFRELHEEVGLGPHDVELVAGTGSWLRYRLPRQYVRRRSQPLCIGQKQRWFLLRMLGGEDRASIRRHRRSRNSTPGAGSTTGRRCARSSISSVSVYARALRELGELAFPDGPPPRPDWWSDDAAARPGRARPRAVPRTGDAPAAREPEGATE